MRTIGAAIAFAALSAGIAAPSHSRPLIDCPLRDQPYSIDSPLMDILLKPEARAVVDRAMPHLLDHLPPMFASTTPPSFAAILSLRMASSFMGKPADGLDQVDLALSALPVTRADRAARCSRYDVEVPRIVVPDGRPRLLVFEKINGFRDAPSVDAANAALRTMAERHGWALVTTDRGAAITPSILHHIDAVIWNNVSGDVLTLTQRRVLQNYIESGGGFVGIHGAGGDPVYYWDWYVDTLIGARFIGHPMGPQFQDAHVIIAGEPNSITRGLAPGWTMNEEWYSFKTNPRDGGARIIAELDESTYSPKGFGGQDLRMGEHPIAWTKCIGHGRSFYTAIGHRPENYSEPHNVTLLEQGVAWAAGQGDADCHAARQPDQAPTG